jgi:hypothetical protein
VADDKDKPRTAADFRDLLKEHYEVPEETRKGKRRERRRARKEHRQKQRVNTRQVLEEERRREPMTAAGAAVIIVVIFGVGFAATHWWGKGDDGGRTTVATSPTPTVTDDGESGASSTPSAPASPSPSSSVAVDLSTPEKTAEGWARVYLARNPPVDLKHETVVERAAPWMTDALTKNLIGNDDKLWNDLVSNGGVSTVTGADVGKAAQGLPVDTPLRVWRKVTVQTSVEGYKKYDKTIVLQAELTHSGSDWRVSRVLGV